MRIKTMLRKWLGVDELETALTTSEKRMIGKQMMRKEIADALMVVCSGALRSKR